MSKTFFTADTHFGHKNILKYSNRPFSSIEDHDETLMTQWNSVVQPNDSIYHLGDFAFCNKVQRVEKYLSQLNGKKYFIFGSHDKIMHAYKKFYPIDSHKINFLGRLVDIKIEDINITLCHYAMLRWPRSHYGTWHLFGHSHGSLLDNPHVCSLDIGVDCFNYTPVSFEQVRELMSKKLFKPIEREKRLASGGIGLDKEAYAKKERHNLYEQLKKEFQNE